MFRELLAAEFSPYAILSPAQLDHLEKHYELLVRWNQRLNLTRIRSLEEVVRFHYCESLLVGRRLPSGSFRIADVGSGAGFPGIPVAVLRSESRVDLVESHQRKAVFLREAARDFPNVQVLARRAEDCQNGYDWMIGRAIRAETLRSLQLAPNFMLLMGADDAVKIPGARVEKVPWGDHRVLVCST
jgi:16S rRNA (guanine(527)-N(7))-methyltransferase RsmG